MRFTVKLAAAMLLGGAVWSAVALPAAATTSSDPTIQRAALLVEWGRWKEARDLMAAAVAANAKSAPLTGYYSHLLVQFGDLRSALETAKRAVALDDHCASCHLYLFEAMAERAKQINPLRAVLQLPKLKKQLEQATSLDPNSGDVQWGWIGLEMGLPPSVGGSTAEAFRHADRLAEIDPVDGHLARASIFETLHRPEQAMEEYRAAATDHPEDARGVFALGKALFERQDYSGAAPHLTQAWTLNPQSALYAGYHAANLVHLRQLEKARAVLEAAAKVHPDSRLGDVMAAQALHDTGQDFAWAQQLLQAYLGVPPEPGQPSAATARALLQELGP